MIIKDQNTFNEILPTLDNHSVVVDVETNGFDSYGIHQICGIGIGFGTTQTRTTSLSDTNM